MSDKDNEVLEQLLDNSCLCDIIDNIKEICYKKAENAIYNWQDESLSNLWEQAGNELDELIDYNPEDCPNHNLYGKE